MSTEYARKIICDKISPLIQKFSAPTHETIIYNG